MLTERRKADREQMAALVVALIAQFPGVTVERTEHDRQIMLDITADRGLRLYLDFDGDSRQPNVFVVPWCIGTRSDACLSDAFGIAAGGPINNFHFTKCTAVQYGFDALLNSLERVFKMTADGSAFNLEREAAKIAKNGGETAAMRSDKMQHYFDEMKVDHA